MLYMYFKDLTQNGLNIQADLSVLKVCVHYVLKCNNVPIILKN